MMQGGHKLRYKTHRAVDGLHEVITTVKVTSGAVNEGQEMIALIDAHTANTGTKVATVVADSQYGTGGNLLACCDKGIRAHLPVVKHLNEQTSSRKGIFPEDRFAYDETADTYQCPAEKTLKKRTFHAHRQTTEYAASKKDCTCCHLREQCTRDNNGRSLQRHLRKDDLDRMLKIAQSHKAKQDLKTLQQLMERSYARSTRFGFDRARWVEFWGRSLDF